MISIKELSERVARNSVLTEKWLASNSTRMPSFEQDAGHGIPVTTGDVEIEAVRSAILDDISAIHDLLIGPGEVLRRICWGVSEDYQLVLEYRWANSGALVDRQCCPAVHLPFQIPPCNPARRRRHISRHLSAGRSIRSAGQSHCTSIGLEPRAARRCPGTCHPYRFLRPPFAEPGDDGLVRTLR